MYILNVSLFESYLFVCVEMITDLLCNVTFLGIGTIPDFGWRCSILHIVVGKKVAGKIDRGKLVADKI